MEHIAESEESGRRWSRIAPSGSEDNIVGSQRRRLPAIRKAGNIATQCQRKNCCWKREEGGLGEGGLTSPKILGGKPEIELGPQIRGGTLSPVEDGCQICPCKGKQQQLRREFIGRMILFKTTSDRFSEKLIYS